MLVAEVVVIVEVGVLALVSASVSELVVVEVVVIVVVVDPVVVVVVGSRGNGIAPGSPISLSSSTCCGIIIH